MQDALWNTTALVDVNGNVLDRFAYTPYGVVETLNPNWTPTASPSIPWAVLFRGYFADEGTGLLHARARQYSPTLGRFVGRDPESYVDGFSLYAAYYVPGKLDPTGNSWLDLLFLSLFFPAPLGRPRPGEGRPFPYLPYRPEPQYPRTKLDEFVNPFVPDPPNPQPPPPPPPWWEEWEGYPLRLGIAPPSWWRSSWCETTIVRTPNPPPPPPTTDPCPYPCPTCPEPTYPPPSDPQPLRPPVGWLFSFPVGPGVWIGGGSDGNPYDDPGRRINDRPSINVPGGDPAFGLYCEW